MTKPSGAKLCRFLVPAALLVVGVFAASPSSNVATSAARPLGMTTKITPAAFAMPDLTLIGQLKIGKNTDSLKSVNWGGTVTLTPDEATYITGDGSASFTILYTICEKNGVAASGFSLYVAFFGDVVARPRNISLGPKQSDERGNGVYLPLRNGILNLYIDAERSIKETNEDNNKFWVNVKFSGF